MPEDTENDSILGIDRGLLEDFLRFVRDKYPIADEANYFLELNVGVSGINIAITNQRDVLSHLVTLLEHPDTSADDQYAQVENAKEHLRRAVIEPYQRAIDIIVEKQLLPRIRTYEETVAPLRRSGLTDAPSIAAVKTRLDKIATLRAQGREAKRRNSWDAAWEDGVSALLDAFEESKQLERELAEWVAQAAEIRERRRRRLWLSFAAILGATAVLTAALVDVFF